MLNTRPRLHGESMVGHAGLGVEEGCGPPGFKSYVLTRRRLTKLKARPNRLCTGGEYRRGPGTDAPEDRSAGATPPRMRRRPGVCGVKR